MGIDNQPRKLATIVALDVAGYSARTEADESKTTAEIAALRQLVDSIAKSHGGRVFNTAGDGFMLEFGSSSAGVTAALELAETCEPRVRVGVHLGEVAVQPNGDLLGHGVNVAARLMTRAPAGSALISADVHRTLRGPLRERLVSRGTARLEKMSEAIEAFGLSAPVSESSAQSNNWRCGIYDYPPLSSWTGQADSTPSGPLIELARMIARSLGKSLTFELVSYDMFYESDSGIPDMTVGIFETRRRSNRVLFSRSVYEIGLSGICRKNFKGDVLQGLRDGNLKVAVYYGEVGWEFVLDELPDAVEDHRVATLGGGHQMHTMMLLREGVYDVVIMDQLACYNFLNIKANKRKFKTAFDQPPQKYRACFALKKDHEGYLERVNAAIVESRNTRQFLDLEREALTGLERIVERRGLRSH